LYLTPIIYDPDYLEIFADNAEYQFTYDANGNIAQQTDAKGQITQYEYDADNRLITSRTFSDSSQTSDNANAETTVNYNYDAANNLISYNDGSVQGSYNYDAADRLIEFTINYGSFSQTAKYRSPGSGLSMPH
jgi:YD repeat-containing protein